MIAQTTPSGLRIGPIQGPRVNTEIKTRAFNPQPLFAGQNIAYRNILREEKLLAKKKKAIETQNKLWREQMNSAIGKAGDAELFPGSGINFDPSTEVGRRAGEKVSQKRSEMQQRIYAVMGSSGEDLTKQREIDLLLSDYQNSVARDEDVLRATTIQKRRGDFLTGVATLEKSGLWVDPKKVLDALNKQRDYLNNPDENDWDPKTFNLSDVAYNADDLDKTIDGIIGQAVNETPFAELVAAEVANPEYEEEGAFLIEKGTIKNSYNEAIELATELTTPEVESYIQARWGMSSSEFFDLRFKGSLLEDEKTRQRNELKKFSTPSGTSSKGSGGSTASGKETSAQKEAREKRERQEYNTKKYGPNWADAGEDLVAGLESYMGYERLINPTDSYYQPRPEQIRDAQKWIESYNDSHKGDDDFIPLTNNNIRPDGQGRVTVSRVNSNGGKDETLEAFGQADFVQTPQKDVGNKYQTPEILSKAASIIGGNEGGLRTDENGGANFTSGDNGHSHGLYQLNRDNFNGFVDFLVENGLEIPEDVKASLDANNADNKEVITNFLKVLYNQLGSDKYLELETAYVSENLWLPGVEKTEEVFGDLHPDVVVFMQDTANQTSPRGVDGIIERASKILKSKDIDPKNATQEQKLEALYEGRKDYVSTRKGSEDASAETIKNTVDSRITPTYQKLRASLLENPGAVVVGEIPAVTPGQSLENNANAPTPTPEAAEARVLLDVMRFSNDPETDARLRDKYRISDERLVEVIEDLEFSEEDKDVEKVRDAYLAARPPKFFGETAMQKMQREAEMEKYETLLLNNPKSRAILIREAMPQEIVEARFRNNVEKTMQTVQDGEIREFGFSTDSALTLTSFTNNGVIKVAKRAGTFYVDMEFDGVNLESSSGTGNNLGQVLKEVMEDFGYEKVFAPEIYDEALADYKRLNSKIEENPQENTAPASNIDYIRESTLNMDPYERVKFLRNAVMSNELEIEGRKVSLTEEEKAKLTAEATLQELRNKRATK